MDGTIPQPLSSSGMTTSCSLLNENVSPHTAHLLTQINFLYKEVERLEKQLQTERGKSVGGARELTKQYEKIIKEKTIKAEEWRKKYLHAKEQLEREEGSSAQKLEQENAALREEKKVMELEKMDLLQTLRRYEVAFGVQKDALEHLQKQLLEKEETSAETNAMKETTLPLSTETLMTPSMTSMERKGPDTFDAIVIELEEEETVSMAHRSSSEPHSMKSSASSRGSFPSTSPSGSFSLRKGTGATRPHPSDGEDRKEAISAHPVEPHTQIFCSPPSNDGWIAENTPSEIRSTALPLSDATRMEETEDSESEDEGKHCRAYYRDPMERHRGTPTRPSSSPKTIPTVVEQGSVEGVSNDILATEIEATERVTPQKRDAEKPEKEGQNRFGRADRPWRPPTGKVVECGLEEISPPERKTRKDNAPPSPPASHEERKVEKLEEENNSEAYEEGMVWPPSLKGLSRPFAASKEFQEQLLTKIKELETEKHQAMTLAHQVSQEREYLASQLHQYEKDLGQLVAHKNISAAHLDDAAMEKDHLQMELQKHIDNENTLVFTIKAKEEELQELLEAYQSVVKENEWLLEGNKVLEREMHNIRSSLAAKEDSIHFLREQLNELNQREQQLLVNVQSFEYETDETHRTVAKQIRHINELEHENGELKQIIHAKDIAVDELHQHLAELNKQIVVQENESIYLQRRCDDLEAECSRLQAGLEKQLHVNKDMEEAHARLMAKSVLDVTEQHKYRQLQAEVMTLQGHVRELERALRAVEEELEKERQLRVWSEKAVEEGKAQLQEMEAKNKRLEHLVVEQNKVFSSLAT